LLFENYGQEVGACHILIYCSSPNLPPLNPGVTNFQGHSFKLSFTHPLPSIIYSPSTWYVCLVSAQNGHTVCTSYLTHQIYCSLINYVLNRYQVPSWQIFRIGTVRYSEGLW